MSTFKKKSMSKSIFLNLFLILFCASLFAQSKSLSNFNSIKTAGSVEVTLINGNTPRAEYTIQKGKSEDLYLEVENNVLLVKIKSKKSSWNRSETKAKITVYYTKLSSIECVAGSSLYSESEIVTENMSIETASGANCNIKLQCSNVVLNSSSGSKISLNGKVGSAKYDASSGSKINAVLLTASIADATVSSGASISLNAIKKLKADASSGGSIKYKGKPENVNIDSGMSGSISSF